jgi:hopene-associated glycosyltransferase HpnB
MIAAASLLAWLWLLALHGRFWQSGPALAPMRPRHAPPIAIVVPARDEAEGIAASIGSLLAQDYPGPFRVVLVDDGSTDGTAAIARALPGADRLTIIPGAPRPAGWAGKLWAVHQGVAATDEPLILLTDADIAHDPAHLATLVAQQERTGCDLVSEMVRLNTASLAERALIPAFVYFFQLLYPFARVNDPLRATAAAAGGTVLVTRTALARIGGIAAIADRLIDDCALATKVKQGGRIWLGHSDLARSIRPYPGVASIWAMVARSAYVQLRHSPLLLAGTLLGLALVFLAPPAYALAGEGAARLAGLLAWTGMAASFLPTLRRYGASRLWTPLLPLVALFYMAATLGAAWRHHSGRGVAWKGRAYAPGRA